MSAGAAEALERVLKAGTRENPFSVDVRAATEGPMRKVWCQSCDVIFNGPLHRARAEYLDHQEEAHGIRVPKIHSFFRDEADAEAERMAWSLRRRG